jgi:serine protease
MGKNKKQLSFTFVLSASFIFLILLPIFSRSDKEIKRENKPIKKRIARFDYLIAPKNPVILKAHNDATENSFLIAQSQLDPYLMVYKGLNRRKKARFVPGEVVVRFNEGLSAEGIKDFAKKMGGRIKKSSKYANFEIISLPEDMDVLDAVRRLSSQPGVIYAEPNYIRYAHFTPNDRYFHYQWHLQKINIEEAWDINFGADPSVIVAVIDTGVAYENYKQFRKGTDLEGTNFIPGFDFVDNDNHPDDEGDGMMGHGTFVTGTIAQTTNNAFGIAGIAFNATIMPLRILDADGTGTTADLAEALYFATLNGASVINMSLGGPDPSSEEEEAIRFAYNSGVVLVASAGNDRDAENPPSDVDYPARYKQVLAVGATDYNNNVTFYSNAGAGLDIVAPGGDTTADLNDDDYGDGILQQSFLIPDYGDFYYFFLQGTSFSAPHISGIAALLISQYGLTEPEMIYDALRYTTIDLGTKGKDNDNGYGLANARNILKAMGIDN